MGRDLITLDCFRESIMRSDALLRPHGIQLYDLLMNSKEDTFSSTVNSAVGIVAIQVNTHFSYCENKWFVFLFSREFFAVPFGSLMGYGSTSFTCIIYQQVDTVFAQQVTSLKCRLYFFSV